MPSFSLGRHLFIKQNKVSLQCKTPTNVHVHVHVPVCVTLLQMCNNYQEVRQLHTWFVVSGLIRRRVNIERLVASYVSCGSILDALSVFRSIPCPDIYAYNTIIRGLASSKCPSDSLFLYKKLLERNVKPDSYTYTFVLKACSRMGVLYEGEQVHAQIIKVGTGATKPDETHVRSSLIHMYASSSETSSAERVLAEFAEENVLAKNSMIAGCMSRGEVEVARHVFNEMPERDSVSWSVMVTGYTKNSMFMEALEMFRETIGSGVCVNESMLVSALTACGRLGALNQGRWIHVYIDRVWGEVGVSLGTCLVDMYARCGCVEFAYEVFRHMPEKDVVTWGVIISGLATNGNAEKCFQLFDEMLGHGMMPNGFIFVALLTACSHAGLVKSGRQYFNLMTGLYGIQPSVHHYGCMVDLLGRAGRLADAEELISTMVEEPNAVIWGALLGACRIHKDVRRGEKAFKELVRLEPFSGDRYKLASHLLAGIGERDDGNRLRTEAREKRLTTRQGSSSIEVSGEVHKFSVGEFDHSRYQEICSVLQG